jgi:uncharacterized membrane protein YsdA (DUF1294 family)/cold shock CspA family protein
VRYQGKITGWNDTKGYGFVTPNGGGTRAFVHIKLFAKRGRRPVGGDSITYEVAKDSKGRTQAIKIRYKVGTLTNTKKTENPYAGDGVAGTFGVLVLILALMGNIASGVFFIYTIMSAVAFLAYAFDKAAALNRRWRTKENTLHLLALLGGWPGALMAQRMFRHKSKKEEFQALFWLTVLANCGALLWSTTESGTRFLKTILMF